MERIVENLKFALSAMIMVTFMFIPFTASGQAGKVSFTGTWALNTEKSSIGQEQGQPPQGRAGNFVATQESNLLTVERTRQGQDGQPQKIVSKYTLDGKESINTSQRGESKSIAKWSADGKTLTIVTSRTFNRDGETIKMNSTETWSLLSPTSLSIMTVASTPNGERKATLVYDKK